MRRWAPPAYVSIPDFTCTQTWLKLMLDLAILASRCDKSVKLRRGFRITIESLLYLSIKTIPEYIGFLLWICGRHLSRDFGVISLYFKLSYDFYLCEENILDRNLLVYNRRFCLEPASGQCWSGIFWNAQLPARWSRSGKLGGKRYETRWYGALISRLLDIWACESPKRQSPLLPGLQFSFPSANTE